jgi:hypothetical protein
MGLLLRRPGRLKKGLPDSTHVTMRCIGPHSVWESSQDIEASVTSLELRVVGDDCTIRVFKIDTSLKRGRKQWVSSKINTFVDMIQSTYMRQTMGYSVIHVKS